MGKGLPRGALRGEACQVRGAGGGLLGGDLGLGRGCFQPLQARFYLLDQPDAAFRALPVELKPQLGDLPLRVGNQRPVGSSLRKASPSYSARGRDSLAGIA
jgi:hypothetical protein